MKLAKSSKVNNNKCDIRIKYHDHLKKPPFNLCLRRDHLQIVTNRKRSLFIEWINNEIAILTIETSIIFTTLGHKSTGRLKTRNQINNHSRNLGLISRYYCTDLVKLIHVEDIPLILNDFQSGKSLLQIKYSSWPKIYGNSRIKSLASYSQNQIKLFDCDSILSSLFQMRNSFYMSAYKTTSFTRRIIKNISNLIGF